jgi:hypothetical protein
MAQDGTILSAGRTDMTGPLESHPPGDWQGVVLSRIGYKWSVLTLMLLADKPRRFGELKRMIGGVSLEARAGADTSCLVELSQVRKRLLNDRLPLEPRPDSRPLCTYRRKTTAFEGF